MKQHYLLAISAFFLWLIGRHSFFRHGEITNRTFQGLFIIKLLACFVLYLIYTRYYPERKYADIFKYYDDSRIVYDSFRTRPYDFFRMITGYHDADGDLWTYYNGMNTWFNSELVFNDSRTMIRLITIFRFFTAGTYHPQAIIFCFMGFVGLCGIYKTVLTAINRNKLLLMMGIFISPSILLWTSGMIKEAFLIFAIGMTVFVIRKIATGEGRLGLNIIAALFFMYCLINIKSYVLYAILPGLISFYIVKRRKLDSKAVPVFLIIHFAYLLFVGKMYGVVKEHSVPELLKSKQEEFYTLASSEKAGSFVEIPHLAGTMPDLLKNAPSAFLLILSRPMVTEVNSPMMLPAALENLFILLLVAINIYFLFKRSSNREGLPLLLLSLFFVVIMFCLIGWVTPILGAAVRYKVAALPFLFIVLFYSDRWSGIENRFEKILKRS